MPDPAAVTRNSASFPGLPAGKRYRPYALYLKEHYGGRLQKLCLDAGMTCPNRDGKLGLGGCTFCSNAAFVPGYARPNWSIQQQIEAGIRFHQRRYRRSIGYMAYFQAYSNTYAAVDHLDSLFRAATEHPQVRGFITGTRPDCLPTEVLDLLADWAQKTEVFVEIGVESTDDAVLSGVNRCHDFACSIEAIHRCAARGLRVGVHLIAGLPGESWQHFIASASSLSALPIHSLKIHQLQIFHNTAMAGQVVANPALLPTLSPAEYFAHVIAFLERLNPAIWIERIGGEAPPDQVVGPSWGIRNDALLRAFEAQLEAANTYQGRLYPA